jgi:hypothetical protein
MTPERKKTINGHLIEEFWWGSKLVVYVDNKVFRGSFEQAIEAYSGGDVSG